MRVGVGGATGRVSRERSSRIGAVLAQSSRDTSPPQRERNLLFEQNRSALVKRYARLGTKYYVLGPPARVKRIRMCPGAWPQPWPEPRERGQGVPIDLVHAGKRSPVVVICVCLLGDALASAFRVGGFLPRWCIRSSVRAGTAVRRGKGPGMHSNLAPISRHPPCGKLSCMHHDLAQSPQSRDAGVGGVGWFNACFRIPRLSRSRVTVHDRYLSRSPGIMSRSPPFLRQLVARLNAGHGVGAGDVRHDVGPTSRTQAF